MLIRPQVIPGQEYDVTAPLRPQSGIDKIKLLLDGNYVTPLFQEAIQKNNPYTLFPADNSICLEKSGSYYLVILNQEYFDFEQDILAQINQAILLLINSNFLIPTEQSMYNGNALSHIIHITEVEFYFDNEPKHLWVSSNNAADTIDQAKLENKFYRYMNTGNELTDTYYSCDYTPATENKSAVPSTVCIYNKQQKDIETMVNKKGVTKEQQLQRIYNHPWKTRLEFRLSADNCSYLNLANFSGTYFTVLGRYKELLSILYNRYCAGKIMYDNNTNNCLQRVIRKAEQTKYSCYFTNKDGKLQKN